MTGVDLRYMPNYTDFDDDKVKEFWELHAKGDKVMSKLAWVILTLLGLMMYLMFTSKLNENFLALSLIAGFWSLGWLINHETQVLHKRIDIIEGAFNKDKSERFWKEIDKENDDKK